jgi:hypothetical protein
MIAALEWDAGNHVTGADPSPDPRLIFIPPLRSRAVECSSVSPRNPDCPPARLREDGRSLHVI